MQDLNELVDLPPGVSLHDAYGINDQGWIVGQTNSSHAYLLTTNPVPLPSTLLCSAPASWAWLAGGDLERVNQI